MALSPPAIICRDFGWSRFRAAIKKATRLDRCTQRAKSTSNQASRSLAISGRGFRSSWQQVTFKSGDRKTLRRQPIEQRFYLLDDRQHVRRRGICIRLAGSDAAVVTLGNSPNGASRIISTKAKPSRAAASCSLRCCSMRCCSATRSASSRLMTPGIKIECRTASRTSRCRACSGRFAPNMATAGSVALTAKSST